MHSFHSAKTLWAISMILLFTMYSCGGDSDSEKKDLLTDTAPQDTLASDTTPQIDTLTDNTVPDVKEDTTEVLPDTIPGEDTYPDTAPDTSPDTAQPDTYQVDNTPNPMEAEWPLGQVIDSCDGGFRAQLESPSGLINLVVLEGDHYRMGFQHGCLVGKDLAGFWNNFLSYFTSELKEPAADMGISEDQLGMLLQNLMVNVWTTMTPWVPEDYLQESEGFEAGAAYAGAEIPGWKMSMAVKGLVILSNVSDMNWDGTLEEIMAKLDVGFSSPLMNYYSDQVGAAFRTALRKALAESPWKLPFATSCSFFGAWGDWTTDGHYIGSRNLDWSTDSGIADLRGMVFFFPTDGFAHVSIGYLGFMGALAGINEKGVTLSEVGSESMMERIKGEPWTLKFRRIMEHSDSLDSAIENALGIPGGDVLRTMTIGYNFGIGFGDPENNGQAASGAALETNGLFAGVHKHAPDCSVSTLLYRYDLDGKIAEVLTNEDDPLLVNLESDAVEIDSTGAPKLFAVDESGAFTLDEEGYPVQVDSDGLPFPTGNTMPCSFYRGDEALMHALRQNQLASNGPGGSSSLLVKSGSYRHRYMYMHDALKAIKEGTALVIDDKTWVPDNQGEPRLVGLDQGEWVAAGAAMGSNVLSVVYDATALEVRVTWEKGSGETWENAVSHPYININLKQIFDLHSSLQAD